MQYFFKEVHQGYISFKKLLPYQNIVGFKCWCIIEFAYVCQVNKSLERTVISFQNKLYIFNLLFNMYYWKVNNVSIAWKIKGKLKNLAWFTFQKTYQRVIPMHLINSLVHKTTHLQNKISMTLPSRFFPKLLTPIWWWWWRRGVHSMSVAHYPENCFNTTSSI